MIEILSQNGKPTYGNVKYILDSPEDLKNLETKSTQGSLAFIISTGEYYVLNGSKKWQKIIYRGGIFE